MQQVAVCTDKYDYDGSCNNYNNKQLDLKNQNQDLSGLPSVSNLSNYLFGNTSNVDRGRSKLTVLAVAYARFFLSDVLEVLEDNMTTDADLYGCGGKVGYGKIVSGTTNYQTPVMDLSPIFGSSDETNAALHNPLASDRLRFDTVTANARNPPFPTMIGRGSVFVSGSPNSNVDHYSIYIHSRFFHLHSKFVSLLNEDCPVETCRQESVVFESARLFVVMVAETIARDLARELGTLPVAEFDLTRGIPAEFLLMLFIDRFPAVLPLYGDTNRVDDNNVASALCNLPNAQYESTLYNISRVSLAAETADSLTWVGYSSMFTLARKGGFLASNLRCQKAGFGKFQSLAYDPVATVIQRGRDHAFPSCQQYRISKGLPNVTFSDFGNAAFAKQFAALYSNDFSAVELSVCMLLDGELRDNMIGSLISSVLRVQNSTNLCKADGSPNFGSTPVAYLKDFSGSDANSNTQLARILQALCRPSPKIDLRGLTMVNQILLTGAETLIYYGSSDSSVDRFAVCTTANPFLAPNSKSIPSRAILKEGNPTFCDWSIRDPAGNGSYLSNAGVCTVNGKAPTPGQQDTRRCFCLARDDCSDHGVAANDKSCNCDAGFNRNKQANVLCERPSYPQSDLGNQFATVRSGSPSCSFYYNDTPPAVGAGNYTSPLPKYCTAPLCSVHEGHYLTGACNNWTNPDLGRIFSTLGRIVPANYPNGISYVPEAVDWSSSFSSAYRANLTLMPQNGLFRGMGKLLIDDAFRSTYTQFNESGMRTGSDASNPTQFKNMVTGWLDESLVFPLPSSYSNQTFGSYTTYGGVESYPTSLTDGAEMGMRTLFARRFLQIYTNTINSSPCTNPGACDNPSIGRCVREIVISEYRSIAREFLKEAKALFPNSLFSFNSSEGFIAPVELGAAKIFDLHFASPEVPDCLNLNTTPNVDRPETCLQSLEDTGLWVQRNLSLLPATTINSLVNQTKILGLGSLNAYLKKLNQKQKDYALLSDNLLLDLHGSAAEYAINFGILEDILNRDQRNETVTATCLENNQFGNTLYTQLFNNFLATWVGPSSTRTLCGLIQSMSTPSFAFPLSGVGYHPRMFLVGPNTNSC